MVNKHRKRCSTSSVVRETQTKTTMRHHFTPPRITVIFKMSIASVDKGDGKREPTLLAEA